MAKNKTKPPEKAEAKAAEKAPAAAPAPKAAEAPKAEEAKAPAAAPAEAKPAAAPAEAKPAAAPGAPKNREERWDLSPREIIWRIGESTRQGEIRDVSDSGCLVTYEGPSPRLGAPVELTLRPPGRLKLALKAVGAVKWLGKTRTGGTAFGVEFAKADKERNRKFLYEALVDD